MRRLSKCVFAAFACLLLGFSATPCRAQDEVRLLHAGLLGYTGGIEDEATLLSPAASGQVFGGGTSGSQPRSGLDLRLGSHSFKNDIMDDTYGGVPFIGLGFTNNISETLSSRVSIDFAFGDSNYGGLSLFMMPVKASLLLHPYITDTNQGYFKPYIGAGLGLSYILEQFDYPSGWDDIDGWGFGLHFLLGVEVVFGHFALGLELGYSAVESSFDTEFGSGSFDTGGLSILFNLGFGF